MPGITIREVAHEAGVSTATVSYILSGTERFSYRPATIAKVREVAERLGYEANGAARLLRQKSTNLIGLTMNIQKTHLNPLVQTAYSELVASGYEPVLIDVSRLKPDMPTAYINLKMLAGILSIDSQIGENIPTIYRRLQESTPVVALYPVASKEMDFVTTDRAAIAPIAVKHLFELGHRRIAFGLPVGRTITTKMKLAGWETALNAYNIEPYAPILSPVASTVQATGQAIVDQLLALNPRPTALICGDDDYALSAMNGLARRGIRVPHDISLISFGFSGPGEFSYPTLTAISVPASAIVQKAVQRLLGRMDDRQKETGAEARQLRGVEIQEQEPPMHGKKAFQRLVKPVLNVRESTAPPPGGEGF
jgi:LacI family transcriptional regulator